MFSYMLRYAQYYALRYLARLTVRRAVSAGVALVGSFVVFVALVLAVLWLAQHGVPTWSSSLRIPAMSLVLR